MLEVDKLDARDILSDNTFAELLDLESEVEKVRLEADLIRRSEELGVKKAFRDLLRAFKKDNERVNPFRCDFELRLTDKGTPADTIDNYLQILRHDVHYAGTLFLNELKWAPEKHIDGKRFPWTDEDDAEIRRYIEKNYHMSLRNYKKLDDALRIVFNENKYHPIKNMIESIKWDGKPRIKEFLCKWMYVEDEPYAHEVSRLIFAGGIKRIYEPGCKFDDMPVLVGRQGEGKSTFVRWIAMEDEFFREVDTIEGQKGIEALEGAWICEMGELLALTRTKEVEAVKAYLTRLNDHYRKPFDKRTSDHARQCIFIGTTNKAEFLTDKTGNRRYYPVVCNNSGYDLFKHEKEIKEDIKQCWAEAKYLYDLGELPAYADRNLLDTIREHQAAAVEDDYRVGMIKAYLDEKAVDKVHYLRDKVCSVELWQEALKEYGKPSRKDSNELSMIMQSIPGWSKSRNAYRFDKYGSQKCWFRDGQIEI